MGMLRQKTVILVTHLLHFLPQVDSILFLSSDGRIRQQGAYTLLLEDRSSGFAEMMRSHVVDKEEDENRGNGVDRGKGEIVEEAGRAEQNEMTTNSSNNSAAEEFERRKGALVEKEERDVGSVKFEMYYKYADAAGSMMLVLAVLWAAVISQVSGGGMRRSHEHSVTKRNSVQPK